MAAQPQSLMALVHWPTEAEAMAFPTLDALRAHCGVHMGVLAAFTNRVGAMDDSIALLAALPPPTVERAIAAGRVITQAANPQAQPPVVEQDRPIGPLEATQVGNMWRIARRCISCNGG